MAKLIPIKELPKKGQYMGRKQKHWVALATEVPVGMALEIGNSKEDYRIAHGELQRLHGKGILKDYQVVLRGNRLFLIHKEPSA